MEAEHCLDAGSGLWSVQWRICRLGTEGRILVFLYGRLASPGKSANM